MMTSLTRYRPLLAATVATLGLLAACGGPDEGPEAQVRAWVEQGEAAVENRDRGALVDMISASYVDRRGYNRDDLGRMLLFAFNQRQSIALLTRIDELEIIDGTAAELVLYVAMAGTGGEAAGFDADAYTFGMNLVLEGDEWRLVSAEWGAIGEEIL